MTTAAVTFAAVTLAAATLAAVTLCRDPRCHTDMKRIEIVPRGNLDAVLLTSHLLIIVYLTINRSSQMKIDTFSIPAAPGRLLRPAPALKIDTF